MRIILLITVLVSIIGCSDLGYDEREDGMDKNPYVPPIERTYVMRYFKPDSLAQDVSIFPVFKMLRLPEVNYSFEFNFGETNPPARIDSQNLLDFKNFTPEFRVKKLKNNTTYYWEVILTVDNQIFDNTYTTGIQEFTTIAKDSIPPVIEIAFPPDSTIVNSDTEFRVLISSETQPYSLKCTTESGSLCYENYSAEAEEAFTIDFRSIPQGYVELNFVCVEIDGDEGRISLIVNNQNGSNFNLGL